MSAEQYATPAWAKVCENHPAEPVLGYMQWHYDAAERAKRREQQIKCGKCGLWVWEEYMVNREGSMTQHQSDQFQKRRRKEAHA